MPLNDDQTSDELQQLVRLFRELEEELRQRSDYILELEATVERLRGPAASCELWKERAVEAHQKLKQQRAEVEDALNAHKGALGQRDKERAEKWKAQEEVRRLRAKEELLLEEIRMLRSR